MMGRMKRLLCLLVIPTLAAEALAQNVSLTLRWDPPTDLTTASYVLYIGNSPGQANGSTPIGLTNRYTITVPNTGTLYFAISAKNAAGLEGVKSDEVKFTPPAIPPPKPEPGVAPAKPTGFAVESVEFIGIQK